MKRSQTLAAAVADSQEEEEDVQAARISGGKLILTADEVYLSPDGVFVQESGDCSIAFRDGRATTMETKDPRACGTGDAGSSIEIERVEIREGKFVMYPASGRIPDKNVRGVTPRDGRRIERRTLASFTTHEGSFTKCQGLKKS